MSKENKTIESRSNAKEIRMKAEGRGIIGVAAVIGESYDMGWYEEVIEEGAFDEALKRSDIRCLLNHNNNKLLGRTSSDTLKVWVEGKELRYELDAPNTSVGNDTLEMLKRGDLKESSFQFSILRQSWEEIKEGDGWRHVRHIEEFDIIYDVAPVTFPANPDTSVAKRSFELFQAESRSADTNKKSIPLSLYEREIESL